MRQGVEKEELIFTSFKKVLTIQFIRLVKRGRSKNEPSRSLSSSLTINRFHV